LLPATLTASYRLSAPSADSAVPGTHRADHDDRLGGVHGQGQEVGGFFQRVGAVGDDDAVHVRLLRQRGHALGERQQVVVGEAFGSDLEHLLAAHVGDLRKFGQAGDQLVDADLGGRVGGAVHGRGAGTGDGAAGGQDHHIGQRLLGLRESAGREQRGTGREGPETRGKVHEGTPLS
jgi:hypothetical protein